MPGLNLPMYDPRLVQPMREELTRIGFQELRTPGEVDGVLGTTKDTTLVVVNSVCGCAARNARPAATLALQHARRPGRLLTVFAGQDADATERARSYFTGYPPSSPQMALFKDGALVFMLERKNIEGRPAQDIAADLAGAFDRDCRERAGRRTAGARSRCATGTRAGSGPPVCSDPPETAGLPPDSPARRRRTARR